ncbi:MAG: hypothetical protein GF320_22000 [Armatimonadia bacterium]|nr:hypothetical protein [Armatimonadia bacterium]
MIEATDELLRDVAESAERLFAATDSVSLERARLVTEAYAEYETEPTPIKRALAFGHVLRHMELDLQTIPLLAGNTSPRPRAWMLLPEYGFNEDVQVGIEHSDLKGFLEGQIPEDLLEFWSGQSIGQPFGGTSGVGHLAVDLDAVVHRGLRSIRDEAASATGGMPNQMTYRRAMVIALDAVMDWALRYAGAAETLAEESTDLAVAEIHRRVATACRRVPAQPARDLFEGLQSIALVQLAIALEGHGMSVSVGSPDRVLAPFADEAEKNPEGAAAIVAGFLLKLASHGLFGRGSKTQAITIGGSDSNGRDCCNAVTGAFLRAFELVPVADPHLFLRWHPGLDGDVWRKATAMLAAGRSMPMLINDETTIRGFVESGIAPEDAAEYCVIGCNELGIPGRMWDSAASIGGGLNFLQVVNTAIDPGDVVEMDGILARVESAMVERVEHACRRREEIQAHMADRVPTPLTSALMRGAAERGCDLLEGMPYRNPGWFERGLSNAADALAVLERISAGDGHIGPRELREALSSDHSDEGLRRRLERVPRWGSGAEAPRRWLHWLLETRTRLLREAEARHGRPPHMPCHVVRSLHYVDGAHIGPSADGRRAGEPVGDSIGAVAGPEPPSVTAVLGDVVTIDAARHYPGGYNLNVTLPSATSAEDIRALAEGFLDEGGQELQVNCLDADRLRAARSDPEAHRGLVVRVAGLSARFVELSQVEQDELIRRAEMAGAG